MTVNNETPYTMTAPSYGSVRALPRMRNRQSPRVVLVLDKIRFALDKREGFEEFCLFAREYPRCYRFHLDCADFRLRSVHTLLTAVHADLANSVRGKGPDIFGTSLGDDRVNQIYWDFESYLTETNIALDLLARVVGPAFKDQSPPTVNKLAKLKVSHPIVDAFRTAKERWINRVKDYRDCFTHYTPVDTLLHVSLDLRGDDWVFRAKLPTNPNVREILGFRFSQRVELLQYAIAVHRRMTAFDRAIADLLWRLHRAEQFPLRTEHLFFMGQRFRE